MIETRSKQKLVPSNTNPLVGSDEIVFNKARLFENAQKLINKFKNKCLSDIIQFNFGSDEQDLYKQSVMSNFNASSK